MSDATGTPMADLEAVEAFISHLDAKHLELSLITDRNDLFAAPVIAGIEFLNAALEQKAWSVNFEPGQRLTPASPQPKPAGQLVSSTPTAPAAIPPATAPGSSLSRSRGRVHGLQDSPTVAQLCNSPMSKTTSISSSTVPRPGPRTDSMESAVSAVCPDSGQCSARKTSN